MGRVAATELMPDFTGRILANGRFKLLESLGAGAYGKVYRALDMSSPLSNPAYYAIKCLVRHPPGSHLDNLQQREFKLHKIVSEARHPNIVTFYRWFRDEKFVYVVLELCSGGDLFTSIIERKAFYKNTQAVKTAFVELLDGLAHSHSLGIFHRDIKPENVLCNKDGSQVKLADFGLSIDTVIATDFGCGSSYYMSPECIDKRNTMTGRYSPRHVDIWALGVILTNMVTGRNPWRNAIPEDDCYSAFSEDSSFLNKVLPISDEMNALLQRLFHINPLRRISVPELRRTILAMKEMYAPDKEFQERLALGNITRKRVEPVLKLVVTSPPSARFVKYNSAGSSSNTSINSDECRLFVSPATEPIAVKNIAIEQVFRSANPEHIAIGCSTPSEGLTPPSFATAPISSGSGPESEGPITPATRAVVLDIEVPDLSNGDHIGQAIIVSAPVSSKKFRPSLPRRILKKTSSKGGGLFRMAIQRLKAMSSGSSSSSSSSSSS